MIYLDNCSTTKPRRAVIDIMNDSMMDYFGNPSSLHRLGLKSEMKIKKVREEIADFLNVNSKEIYFTSGGTESNNLALQSAIDKQKNRGNHIIISKVEHSSVLNIGREYEKRGFRVSYLNVDKNGLIDLDELESLISAETILVSIMQVNSELGSISPVEKIGKLIKEKNKNTIYHVDGVQAFGKINIELKNWKVDLYSFSGHKIYGPKGIGGLYVLEDLKLNPIVYGGNQEKGLRSGTENTIGIIGLGVAISEMNVNREKEFEHIQKLKTYFIEEISKNVGDFVLNSLNDERFSPYILNFSFRNTRGEVILHYLEDEDIYISTSSACSSNGTEKSHVLKSIGLTENEIEGTIRICFSYENTFEEIDKTVAVLTETIGEIREIMMR